MSLAQSIFLVALSVVMLAILWFVGVVVVSARTADGGAYVTWRLLHRLVRPGGDRSELNRWAFYAHRVSGAAIFAFLALHILDVSLYTFSSSLFNNVHQIYGSWPMRVFECGLLFAIVFHTLNGLRLLVIDLGDIGPERATRVLGGVLAVTLAAGVAGSILILVPRFT